MDVALSIQTYSGPTRVGYLLRSLRKAGWPPFPVYVFEDPSSTRAWEDLQIVCKDFPVKLGRRPSWGNMQGCFQYAMEQTSHDLTILMSDDILVQPGWWETHLSWYEKLYDLVGASAFSHWDSCELISQGWIDDREEFIKLIDLCIPDNPWYSEPDIIHAVHGSCFALRRDVWEDQGGFAQDFLAKDEDISRKIWINTDLICAKFPGSPLLHMSGESRKWDKYNEDHPEVGKQTCSYQGISAKTSEEAWQLQIPKMKVGREKLNEYLRRTSEVGVG